MIIITNFAAWYHNFRLANNLLMQIQSKTFKRLRRERYKQKIYVCIKQLYLSSNYFQVRQVYSVSLYEIVGGYTSRNNDARMMAYQKRVREISIYGMSPANGNIYRKKS